MRIGRFQVIEPLAGQGDRRVLAAYDPRLDRKVAIELCSVLEASDAARARRRQEARTLAQLGHPNVVRVHEVGEHEGDLFVATELVRGGTLQDWCAEHPPGTRERFGRVLELMIQGARGLAAAHAAGVVGLALGPTDMLVDTEGRLRLRGRTFAGADGEVDACEDQRELCRTFWEATFGSAPTAAMSTRSDVPQWLLAALRRGLAPAPGDRWPSVDALRMALERGRDGRRRLGALAGVAGGAGLIAALLLWLGPLTREGCRPPADAPSSSWAARRDALEQRFEASGIAGARSHALHTTHRLDQFVAQWEAEHLAACDRADEPDPSADARLACLERAGTSFGVVVDEIERLDPSRLGSASSLTLALPEPAKCRAPSVAVPDVDRDATAREASRRLAEAATLVNLRRVAPAEQIIAALAAAGWAGSASVESHGRLVLGNAAYARGDYEEARAQGRQALLAAERADDTTDAAAAWGILGNAALAHARLDEAAFAAERVESLAYGMDDPLLLADAKAIVASVELGRGHPELAVASFQAAQQLLRDELGAKHPRLASLYQDMVPSLVLAGRLAEAVATARMSLAMFEELLGPESIRSVRARAVLGIALADLGEREEAIEQLARAEAGLAADPDAAKDDRFTVGLKQAEQLGVVRRHEDALAVLARLQPPAGPEAQALLAMTRGTVLLESGRAAEASKDYELLLATLTGDPSHPAAINRAIAHANLAVALSQSGRTEEAVALVTPTIAEYEAIGMSVARLGSVWIEFAGVYRRAGQPQAARRAAERGLAALERGDATPEALARARAELAAAKAGETAEPGDAAGLAEPAELGVRAAQGDHTVEAP